MSDLIPFRIEATVERSNAGGAQDVAHQLVEHGYVDSARVVYDDTRAIAVEVLAKALEPQLNAFEHFMNDPRILAARRRYEIQLSTWRGQPTMGQAVKRDDLRRELYETIGRVFSNSRFDGPSGEHKGGPAS